MKKYNIIIISIIVLTSAFYLSSCKKPKNPKAVITVLDYEKNPVSDATVKVYSNQQNGYVDPETKQMDTTDITDENGQVTFTFKYESILQVKATKDVSNKVKLEGDGVVILTEGETYKETVIIR